MAARQHALLVPADGSDQGQREEDRVDRRALRPPARRCGPGQQQLAELDGVADVGVDPRGAESGRRVQGLRCAARRRQAARARQAERCRQRRQQASQRQAPGLGQPGARQAGAGDAGQQPDQREPEAEPPGDDAQAVEAARAHGQPEPPAQREARDPGEGRPLYPGLQASAEEDRQHGQRRQPLRPPGQHKGRGPGGGPHGLPQQLPRRPARAQHQDHRRHPGAADRRTQPLRRPLSEEERQDQPCVGAGQRRDAHRAATSPGPICRPYSSSSQPWISPPSARSIGAKYQRGACLGR